MNPGQRKGKRAWNTLPNEVTAQVRAKLDEGLKYHEIDKLLGKRKGWARDVAVARRWKADGCVGARWMAEDDAQLLDMRDKQGLTFEEIARRLGRAHANMENASRNCCNRYHRLKGKKDTKRYRRPGLEVMREGMVERTCLGPNCRGLRKFMSKGPENRMCPSCRTSVTYVHEGHV